MELSLLAVLLYKYFLAGAGEQGRVQERPVLSTAPPLSETVALEDFRQVVALTGSHSTYRSVHGHGCLLAGEQASRGFS